MTAPLPGWDELTSERGLAVLARIEELLGTGKRLDEIGGTLRSAGTDPSLIAAALTVTGLRAKAVPKFGPDAGRMFFTQAGLEQASRLPVADLHARRFVTAGTHRVADLGCALGAESLAFLRAGLAVRAVEIDPLTAEFARRNLETLQPDPTSRTHEVLLGDATEVGPGDADGVFLDPARRTSGHRDTRRLTSASDYSPSLDFAFSAARAAEAGGVKLGPGFDRELIPDDAEAQWVSVDGQLVEMGLWFGAAAREGIRRAALVMRAADGFTPHELVAPQDADDAPVRELGEYLIEPDSSVIRARLIGMVADSLEAGMIHSSIAYLTADRATPTPFAQTFRIIEELPGREKDLKKALAARGIGTLEIKKRGVDIDPAALRKRLRLSGPESATLILSRTASRHVALLAERC